MACPDCINFKTRIEELHSKLSDLQTRHNQLLETVRFIRKETELASQELNNPRNVEITESKVSD